MMASAKKLVPIQGSETPPRFTANVVGPANANERITVTVKVRSKDDPGAHAHVVSGKPHVRREDFAAAHGADPATLTRIEEYAKSQGLAVVESSSSKRRVILSGTIASVETAFGVKLKRFSHAGGTYRSHEGQVSVPADLQPDVEAVLGLSNRPIAKPHFQLRRPRVGTPLPHAASGGPSPLSPLAVAQLYDFPSSLTGDGQTIAIIELGGGYRTDDLETYFKAMNRPAPDIVDYSVQGGANTPGNDADGEVMLDIEVASAVAPKAKIVMYFAPNTNQGFIEAITDAAHDEVNKPSVISISWGGPEVSWRKSDQTAMNNAMRDAAMLGVTVTVAAGDNGSADGVNDGKVHVDFPASSPYSLACGGTRLQGKGATIASETVWNDGPDSATGGGFSATFPVPDYQKTAHAADANKKPAFQGRGVPDVGGNADPNSGYTIRVDGQDTVVGGTSAVAPLWAGLIALMNQSLGKSVGYLNPTLYGQVSAAGAFHAITEGNNGAYSAGPGWNPCTGLGSPDGSEILAALKPGTPSKPSTVSPAPASPVLATAKA